MKIRSAIDLEDSLDADLAWRKKEFTTLKFMVNSARPHEREILKKSAISIMYSHWEGHVKHCAKVYLDYLNNKGISLIHLNDNFHQVMLGEKFNDVFSLQKYETQLSLHSFILSKGGGENFKVRLDKVVKVDGNLKSSRLKDLILKLGLNYSSYEMKERFIDGKMLRCRNMIAHGDKLADHELSPVYDEIQSNLIAMIQEINNQVRNSVVEKSYLKTSVGIYC